MDLSEVQDGKRTDLFLLQNLRKEESSTAGSRENLRKVRVSYFQKLLSGLQQQRVPATLAARRTATA